MSHLTGGTWKAHPRACPERTKIMTAHNLSGSKSPRFKSLQILHHSLNSSLGYPWVGDSKNSSPASCRSASHPRYWQTEQCPCLLYVSGSWTYMLGILTAGLKSATSIWEDAKRSIKIRLEPGCLYHEGVHWYPGGKGGHGLEPWPWC